MRWSAQDESRIEAEVRRLLEEVNPEAAPAIAKLEGDAPLLGVLDSRRLLETVEQLEQVFGIRVDETHFTPDNFETMSRIVSFVAQQLRKRELGGDF